MNARVEQFIANLAKTFGHTPAQLVRTSLFLMKLVLLRKKSAPSL